jgi:hypothetical protein
MDFPAVVQAILLTMAAVVVVLVLALRARRAPGTDLTTVEAASPIMRLEPGELATVEEPSDDLDTVMADAGAALYIPIDSGRKYLAVAHPDARIEERTSSVPSQLVGAAVAGQAGLEALVKAGQLTRAAGRRRPHHGQGDQVRCAGHRQGGQDARRDQGERRVRGPD